MIYSNKIYCPIILVYVFLLCKAVTGSYCIVEDRWAPWEACNDTCGGQGGLSPLGVQQRQKYIGCDRTKYNSLIECLNGCNIKFSWWQANATEFQSCRKCMIGGKFDSQQNSCICPNGYGGACCDVKTTTSMTTSSTTTTTTTSTTDTATSTTISASTTAASTETTKTATISDKDHCADQPCQYGKCIDEIDDFYCDCMIFFNGKTCNKLTPLAIAFVSLAALGLLLIVCCFYWKIVKVCKKGKKRKVKPVKERNRPKPMTRAPRYDW
ncbi:uncharacterized protein LOC143051260 [Mytilus galloprovincialis]|uniref:uncharacterized protein LOC143051260 n=1 Tax=Mytilus galloprovincialis TaxID=29158 RepID=UPI003F7CCFF6